MQAPAKPQNEAQRLQALRDLEVLDSVREERFDRLTRLASFVAGTPIALISLIDSDRQWFKSRVGLDATETPRDISFCGHAILGDEMFEIPDASQDPRFSDNPLVTETPDIRFYAGVPLKLRSGHTAGTLCVIDQAPKSMSDEQKALLRDIASTVVEELEVNSLVRQAREQLKESELLRTTVATIANGIVSITDKGIIQTVNPAVQELFGYEQAGLIGKNVNILMPEPDRSRHDGYLERYLREGHARIIGAGRDVTGRRQDGSLFPMHLSVSEMEYGGERYFTGVVHDTTAETSLRNELQAALDYQQAILNSASVAIISTDEQGTVLSFNHGAETLLGYQAAELIGQASAAIFHDPDEVVMRAAQLSEELGRDIEPGFEVFIAKARLGAIDRSEWSYLHKSGKRIPVELGVSALRDSTGTIRGFLGIATDIGERKEVERAKSEFVSTVSHELRTPLTSVRGALGLVLSRFADELPEKGRNLLENASRNSERLSLLINDILDMEKLDAGHMEFDFAVGDLRGMLDQAIANNHSFAGKYDVHLQLNDAPDTAPAYIDNHRLQQVMSNLLSNAIKYAPSGSTVEVGLIVVGRSWRISVRDRGRGIPEAFRSRTFQRFAQADSSDAREKGGTGLGLSIAKAIVEGHKGRIGFETEEGKGTEFFFFLPQLDQSQESDQAVASSDDRPRVLVCTESESVGDALCLLLNHNRFYSEQCQPEQAQHLLLNQAFRALLLDLSKGIEPALTLLQRIRANESTREIPVIIISSQPCSTGMAAALQGLSVYHWLQKPVDRKQLQQALLASGRKSSHRPRLLHVEDDLDVVQIVKSVTEDIADYDYAGTLKEAREKLLAHTYDLLLLDLTLPDGDGRSLLGFTAPPMRVIVFSGEQVAVPAEGDVIASLVKSQVTNDSLLSALSQALAEQPDERPSKG